MEQTDNILDMRRYWRSAKKLWWLYLASTLICVGAASWYVSRSLTKLPIKGEMLIGEESFTDGGAGMMAAAKNAGGISQMMKTFSVGGFGASAVDNEVLVLSSHDVMLRTVKTLGLNLVYIGKNASGDKAQLWKDTPVRADASEEYFDTLSTAYNVKVNLLPNGKANLIATKGFFKKVIATADNVTLPTALKTPYGTLQILRGETFDSSPYREINISVAGNQARAIALAKDINIDIMTKLSDVIELNLDYPNKMLGKAIVDGVMAEYNAKRLRPCARNRRKLNKVLRRTNCRDPLATSKPQNRKWPITNATTPYQAPMQKPKCSQKWEPKAKPWRLRPSTRFPTTKMSSRHLKVVSIPTISFLKWLQSATLP